MTSQTHSAKAAEAISFVTTCKGRLHHIKQTLPKLLAESPDEIVVVDYGCPQNVGDWIEENHKSVKVVRVTDDPGFCVARARNIGALNCSSPWICFVDADILVEEGFVAWTRQNVRPNYYYRHAKLGEIQDKETYGTVICSRKSFETVNGYDELFRSWGGEDDDLYYRFGISGYSESYFPFHFVSAISHGDSERFAFHQIKDKNISHMVSQFYMVSKRQLMAFYNIRTELPIEVRTLIQDRIRKSFNGWGNNQNQVLPRVTITLDRPGWLPFPYRMKCSCVINIEVDKPVDMPIERAGAMRLKSGINQAAPDGQGIIVRPSE